MADFPHLRLPIKVEGIVKPSSSRGGGGAQQRTLENRDNRVTHGQQLSNSANAVSQNWNQEINNREEGEFDVPNKIDIPIFLEIDTNTFNVDSLRNWGIELISEEKEGFIIGASLDNFELFQKNVQEFIKEEGRYKNAAAQIWNLEAGVQWRIDYILKGALKETWGNINDAQQYIVEIGVSCPTKQMKDYPSRSDFDSEEIFEKKLKNTEKLRKTLGKKETLIKSKEKTK